MLRGQRYLLNHARLFERNLQITAFILLLKKAFNKVHHGMLIAKLAGYGIVLLLLNWISAYLGTAKKISFECEGVCVSV